MENENKYTIHMKLAFDEQVNSKIMSNCLEDALLLYAAKTGQKIIVTEMAVYNDFMQGITLPEFRKVGSDGK